MGAKLHPSHLVKTQIEGVSARGTIFGPKQEEVRGGWRKS